LSVPTIVKRTENTRLFRVLLEVADLAAGRQFYESLLAIGGRAVGGGRVYFDSGSVILALVDVTAEGAKAVGTLPEPLYFSTDGIEEVYARAGRLRCLSTDLIHNDPANPAGEIVVRPWGERSFYAFDPFGNPLCFVDGRTLFTGSDNRTPAPRRAPKPRAAVRPRALVTQRRSLGGKRRRA
jgi:hypothetical protein